MKDPGKEGREKESQDGGISRVRNWPGPENEDWGAEMREDRINTNVERLRWIRFGDTSVPDRPGGLRFAAPYRQCVEEAAATHVYDVIKKHVVPAGWRYAVSKRQLSARASAKRGLQNDNRFVGGPAPQMHKRQKRQRTRS